MSEDKVKLTVISAHGSPDPKNGYEYYNKGEQITCKVTSPVTENRTVWTCEGWSGTGSVPPSGEGTEVTFPITQDSTITWNWLQRWHGLLVANPEEKVAQVASLIVFVLIVIFAALSYELRYVLPTVALAGAMGGLVHELLQSQGTYILPKTDSNGNFCLGGLIGIFIGLVAAFIFFLGIPPGTPVSAGLFIEAFLAGVAAKAVADAPNPPKPSS